MLPSLVKPLNHNPLYRRLIIRQSAPSLQATIVLAVVVALASLLLSLLARQIMFVPACLLNFIMPFVAAVTAASLTAREVADPSFRLIEVTNVTKRHILQAYTLGTLYRLRVRLAIALGLLPGLIAGYWATLANVMTGALPDAEQLIISLLMSLSWWGWNLTAATLGAWEGYVLEEASASIAGTIILTAAGMMIHGLLIYTLFAFPLPLLNLVGMVALTSLPYLAAYLMVTSA